MEAALLKIVQTINSYLTDYILIFLLIGVGLFFTIRTRFVQVRCFGEGMKNVFGKITLKGDKSQSGLSSFQALATAVAAQVGTGNIVGACGAILVGGPGAIFWMWVIAFFGMATIYAEATLAQKTKKVNEDGTVEGGPVYYIKTAFKGKFGKFLAAFFAVATILALGFMGSMVQSNSIAGTATKALGIDADLGWIIGLVVAALAAAVFLGGIKRLASVTEKVVPFMACLYLVGGLVVIFARIQYIPETFGMIFKYAFNANALIGGGIGFALKTALSQGAKRGLFSNEAGMGSTPHAHAQANVKNPHEQGTTAMIGVFIDTFIVLTMTALVVISTLYAGNGALGNPATYTLSGALDAFPKANLAQMAFGSIFWGETFGSIFVAVCLFFFAFSTILSWNFFGKINFEYLFKKKGTIVYTVLAIVFVFLGSLFSNDLVWELTDFFNYLMVLPNAIALIALGSLVVSCVKEGTAAKKAEKEEPAAEEKTDDAE
ncbi:MAG: alanine:cation symporter family protein [Ruminococcaceae bacterium]|nr:alanine:cation symporter family protein [Oscillospiraceae bacterium]